MYGLNSHAIPQNFKTWACSLAGCDGGNPKSDIWISGIEWGGGSYENGKYYREELPAEIAEGAYDQYSHLYDWSNSLTYPYGRSFAKIYTAIQGHKVGEYRERVSGLKGSEVFKLNLYPIAFDSTDPTLWKKFGLEKITGFSEKCLFQAWCFYNRFPAISKLVEEHKPKIIIGTGVSYLLDFFACFGGTGDTVSNIEFDELTPASESNRRSNRRYYWVKVNSFTTLFVIPFFSGSSGLNSDHLLQEMGIRIRAEYT